MASKPKILFVYPGPLLDFEFKHKSRLEALSEHFSGTVITTNWFEEEARYGEFDYRATFNPKGSGLMPFWRLYKACVAECRRRKKQDGKAFDLIVLYDPLKIGMLGLLLRSRFGGKVVVEVNGDFSASENYATGEMSKKARFKRWAYMKLEKWVLGRADGIRLLYDDQIAWAKIKDKPISRIFDYQGLEHFKNISDNKEILFIGHPFYLKGVDLLLEAFKAIADDYKDWRLKIVGWFSNIDEVKAAIDNHPQIDYLPAVRSEEVVDLIGNCGILALPSRTEAMGRVLLEAMAAEKPRIGARVGGIPTVIEHQVDGLLFDKGNGEQLKQALEQLVSDDSLRKKMAQNGLRRYEKEFSVAEYSRKATSFYSQVIGVNLASGTELTESKN